MWCLDQGDQQGHSDRAQARNLSQKLRGGMPLAFCQQLAPRFSMQRAVIDYVERYYLSAHQPARR